LVVGDEAFTIGAANLQEVAAPDFLTIRVLIDFH